MDGADIDLNVRLRRQSNGLWRLLQDTAYLDQRLGADLAHPFHEVGIISIAGEDALDGVRLVAEEQEVEGLGELLPPAASLVEVPSMSMLDLAEPP
ncbi:hypothetical protein FALCPG4_015865 [Fusarium falciforme]